jgi:hypothetical protein
MKSPLKAMLVKHTKLVKVIIVITQVLVILFAISFCIIVALQKDPMETLSTNGVAEA